MNDTNLTSYNLVICAVVFGVDASILNVQLNDDFSFQRKSLTPLKDHLDIILQTNGMGLRQEYEKARIDESLDVICIFKEFQFKISKKDAKTYYDKICTDTLMYLDDKIRAIRFFIEAPIRFKKLSINMKSETLMVEDTKMHCNFSSLIPVPEAMTTQTIHKFSCTDEEIRVLNKNITDIKFPLENKLLNTCYLYYDLSYHQSNFVSVTLLITCLEILFLENEKAKKEKLSKRCAVFLFDTNLEQIDCYKELILCYKKRSDFVHDGNYSEISNKDILFLRKCTRQALVKYLRTDIDKKSILRSLKDIISNIDYLK